MLPRPEVRQVRMRAEHTRLHYCDGPLVMSGKSCRLLDLKNVPQRHAQLMLCPGVRAGERPSPQ